MYGIELSAKMRKVMTYKLINLLGVGEGWQKQKQGDHQRANASALVEDDVVWIQVMAVGLDKSQEFWDKTNKAC